MKLKKVLLGNSGGYNATTAIKKGDYKEYL